MFKNFFSYMPVLRQMLYADYLTFKEGYVDMLIDNLIWTVINVVVMGYLLTGFGIRADFGLFTAATGGAVNCMFQVFPRAVSFLSDIVGNKVITYDVTLPLPSWMAIARVGLSDALQSFSVAIIAAPIGLLFVWNQFNPANFSPFWFICMLTASAFFFGFFGLFLASLIKDMSKIRGIWMRVMFPLWFLGGFQFTWQVLYAKAPLFAYAVLLNPFLYAMEGMRAAVMGQAGSLPLPICFATTVGFTFLCGYVAVSRIMKRLDCV